MTGWETTIFSTATLIVGLALRELPAIVMDKVFMKDTKKEKSDNGRLQLREDVKDVFESTLKAEVLPLLAVQSKSLESIAETNTAIRDGIVTLVALARNGNGSKRRR